MSTVDPNDLAPTFRPAELDGDGFRAVPWTLVDDLERRAREIAAIAADPAVALWNPLPAGTPAHAERWIAGRTAAWERGDAGSFALLDPVRDDLLGAVTIRWVDRFDGLAMIGYWLDPAARGRGLATRATRTVTEWAFARADARRIELAHATGNAASCAVALRAGYPLEGTLRASHRFGDGRHHDEHLHARLATD
ncbi:GNAT family N-acetyltransferase [Kitasatospora albolonga]|uniref:GNAT family N-acetyltransferase n=1 Tax=Kitasatospora albolonga TaxID=68173 RepID=UPI0031EF9BDB